MTIALSNRWLLCAALAAAVFLCAAVEAAGPGQLSFVCAPDNDLYRSTTWSDGGKPGRYATLAEALEQAAEGFGILVLADDYPAKTTPLSAALFETALAKRVRLYVEFPSFVPDLPAAPVQSATWERVVVTSGAFGAGLEKNRLLMVHDCHFVPFANLPAHLSLARVAGFDTAVYGLPSTGVWPVLFESSRGGILVASTKLSQFLTARYGPDRAWAPVWNFVFSWLANGRQEEMPRVAWTPNVRPSYSVTEPLPSDARLRAVQRGVDWFSRARLLAHPDWADRYSTMAPGAERVAPGPEPGLPLGNGSRGVLEAFSSTIRFDGSQPVRWYYRDDCNSEVAMAYALRSTLDRDPASRVIASNILDFVLFQSNLQQGPRADTNSPSFGLVGWDTRPEGATVYYGDDNARAALGQLAVSAALGQDRWDEPILRSLLANFRVTGPSGFQNARIEEPELQQRGWRWFWQSSDGGWGGYRECPHYQAYQWALRLWLYDKTRFEPLLQRTKRALRHMMRAYPNGWQAESAREEGERCRMLLPLAWLVRVEDTPEHRAWLKQVADYVLSVQDASGAIAQKVTRGVSSNGEYGTSECALIYANGDPATDLLYAGNFALLGLQEAAAATGDAGLANAAAKLGDFLVRAQVRSRLPAELDGAWFRGFDFGKWDFWGSNGDVGWGVWSTETGWTQGWIAAVLALQEKRTSLWELTSRSRIARHMDKLRPLMLPDDALPGEVAVGHAAKGRDPVLVPNPAPQYSADGPRTLTDGQLAEGSDFHERWLGWLGSDMTGTLDLGSAIKIERLQAHFLQHIQVGIFLPREVEFALSADGKSFEPVGVVKSAVPEREAGPLTRFFELNTGGKTARFVRVTARNLGKIPAWHERAPGVEAWLFCDEILVNPAPQPAQSR